MSDPTTAFNNSAPQGAPCAATPRPMAHHDAPPRTMAHQLQKLRNEANCQNDTLTPLQCAALRHLLAGHRPTFVARGLKIDRHTLLRWRRHPAFQAELQRLHLQLASNAKPKPAAPTPPARQSVDQIMALYGYGGNSPATPL